MDSGTILLFQEQFNDFGDSFFLNFLVTFKLLQQFQIMDWNLVKEFQFLIFIH